MNLPGSSSAYGCTEEENAAGAGLNGFFVTLVQGGDAAKNQLAVVGKIVVQRF